MDKKILRDSSTFKLLILRIVFLSIIIIALILAKFIDKNFSSEIKSFYHECLSKDIGAMDYLE